MSCKPHTLRLQDGKTEGRRKELYPDSILKIGKLAQEAESSHLTDILHTAGVVALHTGGPCLALALALRWIPGEAGEFVQAQLGSFGAARNRHCLQTKSIVANLGRRQQESSVGCRV
jgi:hypothetical protein